MNKNQFIKLRDGRKLAYCEYGVPSKEVIFYFHGWPASRLSGEETDKAAKKLGVRVISPDRPGFGLSDYQENRNLIDWPKDIIQLADQLHINKFAVMGVSGGGPYAAACAHEIPKRLTSAGIVVGLSPVNVRGVMKGMSFTSKIGWKNYHRHPFLSTLGALSGAISYKYLPFIGNLVGLQAKEDRILLKSKTKKRMSNSIKEAYRQGIKAPAQDLRIYTGDWGFKLSDIKTKVYLWYGEKDKNVSVEMGKYYSSKIPNSELFTDKDGGHLSRNKYEEKILKALTP